jgi:hypothetical protein
MTIQEQFKSFKIQLEERTEFQLVAQKGDGTELKSSWYKDENELSDMQQACEDSDDYQSTSVMKRIVDVDEDEDNEEEFSSILPANYTDGEEIEAGQNFSEDEVSEHNDADMLKLTTLALKQIPGSPKQRETIKKLNVLRKKAGLKGLAEMEIDMNDEVNESVLGENIGVKDGRRVVVKALTKPAALRLKKKLRNKFSSWDTSIDKSGLSMIVPNEKPIIRYLQKQPEVDKIGESIEEAFKFWTVTITKKAGKLFKGQTVDVKARSSAEAIKKGIKQMKGNPALVPGGSVTAELGEAYDAGKKHTMDPKSHVELNKETGMYCVYNIKGKKVAEFKTKEEAEEYAVKNHDSLMKESVDLEEALKPADFVKGGDAKVTKREVDGMLSKIFINTKLAKSVEASKAFKAGEKDAGKKKNPYKSDTADFHLYELGSQSASM